MTMRNGLPAGIHMVQQTIDRIEDSLEADIVLEDLARAAGMSFWHFLRVFRTTVGETLKDYIRRRRLTVAAWALLESERGVLDIALSSGFDSHEAFSRAFKSQFACSPRQFRQQGQPPQFPRARLEISAAYLAHLQSGISREPALQVHADLRLVGMQTELTVPPQEFDVLALGAPLWQAFLQRVDGIGQRLDDRILFICDILASNDEHVRCMLMPCVAVSGFGAVPESCIAEVRPGSLDAVFQHRGGGQAWEYTMQYVYGCWLPESGHSLSDLPLLYRFDPRHSPFCEQPELEVWLALGPPA